MNKFNLIISLTLVYIAILFSVTVFGNKNDLPTSLAEWQAVFLADGQVYFGHLEKGNDNFFILSSVYYLKYSNSIQQDKNSSVASESGLDLIKLGAEVHGPEDKMFISKDKVSFVENLKDNSTVVSAIKKNTH